MALALKMASWESTAEQEMKVRIALSVGVHETSLRDDQEREFWPVFPFPCLKEFLSASSSALGPWGTGASQQSSSDKGQNEEMRKKSL